MKQLRAWGFLVFLVSILAVAPALFAGDAIGPMRVTNIGVDWAPGVSYDHLVLRVSAPDGTTYVREFKGGEVPSLRLQDLAANHDGVKTPAADGAYTYELQAVPKIAPAVQKQLAAARAADDDAAVARIQSENHLDQPLVQSGAFTVQNGSLVRNDMIEPATPGNRKFVSDATNLKPAVNDQVIADDLIVQGSICGGLDCVNNESFGFDTLRLKENNVRIKFDDTSTAAGFPNNDWQLTANDSASGGANKFSIDDITNSKTPFTVTANSPTNSIFVASTGKVGFGNASPVLNLHITATDTPAIRQEQTNGGGFTAQTWDIGANEANWFVRDVTGGSRLPLRIRPGAPTSSVDIQASGNVGIGTASAAFPLDVTANVTTPVRITGTSNPGFVVANGGTTEFTFGIPTANGNFIQNSSTNDATFRADSGGKLLFSTAANGARNDFSLNGGNAGINCTAPSFQFVISASGTNCGTPSSSINAGSAQFTIASSRTFKENMVPVAVPDILQKVAAIPVYTYDYKNNGPKDRLGLIAEDFHQVFARGSEKYIDGQEVQMALWLAVQQLTEQNKQLANRVNELEKALTTKGQQ